MRLSELIIQTVSEAEIEEILQATIQRYSDLHPDWEICTIAIQKRGNRNEQLDAMIDILSKLKKKV